MSLVIVILAGIEHVTRDVSIFRDNAALAGFVQSFNDIVFDPKSFLPLVDMRAVDLFGYRSQIRNMGLEYQFSGRVMVDLLEPGYGADFERARNGIRDFVLDQLVAFAPEGSVLLIRAMTLLLQVPFGGECQVWHTDEAGNEDESDFVFSILIPCHRQSAPVFLTEMSRNLGPCGVKPVLAVGDMAFWDAINVMHAGSSADGVPPGHLLRAAIFIAVGSSPPKPGEVLIHSDPDVEQWKDCAHPIVRFCVRCRRGVQPCEPSMKFCSLCAGLDGCQATAVVCQWCHASDDHLHSRTSATSAAENQLVIDVWCGYASGDKMLCVHGNRYFQDMSESERLLLHFDEGELCGGFTFWREFMLRVVPDECYFQLCHRSMQPEVELPWKFFFKFFVNDPWRKRFECRRCYWIIRVSALICGFSSLFEHADSDHLSGSIPIFVASSKFSAHAEACFAAFRVAQANAEKLQMHQIDADRIRRALLWVEKDGVTTHCSCTSWAEYPGTAVPLSFHHQVRKCPGAILDRFAVPQQSQAVNVWNELFVSQVVKKGEDVVSYFALLLIRL